MIIVSCITKCKLVKQRIFKCSGGLLVGIAYVLTLMMLFRITIQLVVGFYSEIAMVTKIRK
jgi:hypothetical protein